MENNILFTPQNYVLVIILMLALIWFVLILGRKKIGKPLSRLAIFAFLFVLAGIILNNYKLISYFLSGIGGILALIDIRIEQKKRLKH
ncbi:MAG: hypothetical protein PHW15_02885 [Patescibacteria group bacterium]|jgi:hypothetical protein|nr:hypothetical protein [Patescibacteria group bacterium]MDD5172797.1 hypothetical protein [Patescibacteria group bacterium]